jgi:hypothetical protein
VKILSGELIIDIYDEFYHVKAYYKGIKLKKKFAYILDDDCVLPYMGKMHDNILNKHLSPGIYKINNSLKIIMPNDNEMEKYNINNVREINIDKIFDKLTEMKGNVLSVKDIEMINTNSNVYAPPLRDDDDFLKRSIKLALADKQINLKTYADKFKTPHDRTNKMGALTKSTKMSVNYFTDWCEILGLNYELKLFDNGTDLIKPLSYEITVSNV